MYNNMYIALYVDFNVFVQVLRVNIQLTWLLLCYFVFIDTRSRNCNCASPRYHDLKTLKNIGLIIIV